MNLSKYIAFSIILHVTSACIISFLSSGYELRNVFSEHRFESSLIVDLTAESNDATPSYPDPQRESGDSRTSSFQEADLLHSLPPKQLIEPLAPKHHREKGNLVQPNPLTRIQGLKVHESSRPIFDQIFGRTFIFKLWALKRTARLEEGQVSKQQMAAEMAISSSLREKMRKRFERNCSYLKPRPLSTTTLVWKENARIYYAYSFFKQ